MDYDDFMIGASWLPQDLFPNDDEGMEADDGAEDVCSVCLEQLQQNHAVELVCKHRFCKACIHQWFELQATCPLCRTHDATEVRRSQRSLRRRQLIAHAILVLKTAKAWVGFDGALRVTSWLVHETFDGLENDESLEMVLATWLLSYVAVLIWVYTCSWYLYGPIPL